MAKPQREREIEEDRDDDILDDADKNKDTSMLGDDDLDEEDDGSDNAAARREQEREARRKKAATDDEDDEDETLGYDEEEEEESRPRGRRARRNQARRARDQQQQQLITSLYQEVVQQRQAIEGMSRSQLGLAAGDIDGQIAQLQSQLAGLDEAHAKAVSDGRGEDATKAMRLSREAEARLQGLTYERRQLEAAARRQAAPQQRQEQQRQTADPRAVAHSNRFMDRYDWFDPNDPTDEDSNIVKALDAAVESDGFDPSTKRYWTELERRMKKRGLIGGDGDDMDDDDDDRSERRERRRPNSGGLPPRSRSNAGQGRRETGFKLTPLMKEALEAEGLLDEKSLSDDQKKYRKRLVTKWRDGTEAARQARR